MRRILDSPISVMNDALRWLPVGNSHIQGCKTQSGIYVARNGITDGSPRKQIQNNCQIDEAVSDAHIGDVCRPDLIRCCNNKVLCEIGINPLAVITIRRFNPAALGFS